MGRDEVGGERGGGGLGKEITVRREKEGAWRYTHREAILCVRKYTTVYT